MRKAAFMVGLLFLAAGSLRGDDTIIIPRTAPANGAAAKTQTGFGAALPLTAIAAAAVGGWMLWSKRRSLAGSASGKVRKLAVGESRSLGNRQYLVVADYDGRKFLLGVCPGHINLISRIDDSSQGQS